MVIPGRLVPALLGGVLGEEDVHVQAVAEASWSAREVFSGPCVFCVLQDFRGQVGHLTVDGGSVAVNGDMTFNNANGIVDAVGGIIGYAGTWNHNGSFSPAPVAQEAFTDPFASLVLPPPEMNPAVAATAPSGACTPGNYTSVTGCTSFTPGVYVLAGGSHTIHGGVDAHGAVFYLTCVSGTKTGHYPRSCAGGEAGASLAGAGNGDAAVWAPDTGPYQGLAVIGDRNNATDLRWTGNGALTVHGTLYAPAATLDLRGNGSYTSYGVTVVGYVDLRGNHDHVYSGPGEGDPVPPGVLRRQTQIGLSH